MSCGYIYKIQFSNGKHYIGLTTTSLNQRKNEHKKSAKQGDTKRLYTALRKYDMIDTFELIEIDRAETLEELCKMEIKYIQEYNSYYMNQKGYNMTYGGEGTNGYIFTEEDRKKQSAITTKYFENPEAREKQSKIIKKYFENPEAREKMSKIKKKYFEENPEAGKEQGEIMKKYYQDNPEARQHASEKTTKYFEENQEARQHASEKTINHFKNPEAREKHSEIIKKYYEENPEAREKMSEIKKKYYEENPKAREKNIEAQKKYYEENPEAKRKLLDGRGKNIPFDVFTCDGTFIQTFTYQYEAKEYLQKEYHIESNIKISEVLTGRRKTSAGFIFKYK
jgi:hypothetical protein